MSRTKSFAINAITEGLLQVLTLAVGLVLPKIILTIYGSAINGLVTSITQFVGYLMLVEAGLSGAAIFSLYKPLSENNHYQINVIISTIHTFYKKSGYIFLSLLLGISFLYPVVITCKELTKVQITMLILLIGCKGVFELFFMGKYRALLTADQRVFVVSISSMASLIVNSAIIISLALCKYNIVTVYSYAVSALVIKSLILSVYVKKKYGFLTIFSSCDKTTISQRWDVLYLQVLGVIQRGVPIIALTFFATLPIVSVYAIYNLVIVGLAGLLGIFVNGLFSSFGDVIARNELRILQKAYSEFEFVYYTLITWVYSCTIILIVPFVTIYTKGITDTNYVQPLLGILITLNAFLYNLKTPQGMMVLSAGLYRETRYQTTTQGLIALVLCLILAKNLGLTGVMLGMMVSNIYRDIDLLFFIPKHVTKLPVMNTIYRIIINSLILISSAFYCYYYPFSPVSISEWLITAALVSSILGGIIIGVNCLSEPKHCKAVILRMQNLFI